MVSSWVPGCIRGGELDLTLLPCVLRCSYSRDYNFLTSVRGDVSWHLPVKYITYLCSPQPTKIRHRTSSITVIGEIFGHNWLRS